MTEIDSLEEAERDWDWFATGSDGTLGHFTTDGKRALPRSVKRDRDAALLLIRYFEDESPKSALYTVILKDEGDRYLRDYVRMASAGLFSYDAPIYAEASYYFMVAMPKQPLRVDQLPADIRNLVMRTQAPCVFGEAPRLRCEDTTDW